MKIPLEAYITSSYVKYDRLASLIAEAFAGYDDTTDAYYLISDGKYLYIIYMSEEEYKKVYNE